MCLCVGCSSGERERGGEWRSQWEKWREAAENLDRK